ncbi:hypothetical protein CMT41_10480 [Colwellia sp. MT41]|nr:hypothetical protein CMT41_10480 [Colwellia sp. MT41]
MYDNENHLQWGLCVIFTYFEIQTTAINSVRQKVRYAEDEDNPQLLSFWLMAEQTLFTASDINVSEDARWQLYQGQFRLLLDAICDNLLSEHWRQLCLDNIYRPLTDLNRISQCEASKKRLRHLWLELNITSQYFHC